MLCDLNFVTYFTNMRMNSVEMNPEEVQLQDLQSLTCINAQH